MRQRGDGDHFYLWSGLGEFIFRVVGEVVVECLMWGAFRFIGFLLTLLLEAISVL